MHSNTQQTGHDTATIGGGCFWCLDAVFRKIQGVMTVASGFAGGDAATARYEIACSGQSDHIEVVHIEFDPAILPYEQLLAVFFAAHDPTQINRQGHDVGPQYRSVIFHHGDGQRQTAQNMMNEMTTQALFDDPIATELRPAMPFYPAPDGHQDFYNLRQDVPYCHIIIQPKLDKIQRLFGERLI
ncbi:MAG: peptide-methionine (S)-S-oxide reductase MsrA [Algicola sp.]|nr:peptide-methionine (S)-S-oxide reductase MsrA [Algicola sp.]